MSHQKKSNRNNRFDTILRWISLSISLIGAADALYLLVLKFSEEDAMCIGSHGCITVNNSPYSMIYGIPVSLLGLVAYLVIAGVHIFESRTNLAATGGPLAIFGISLAGFLFSAYLTYLEYFVIDEICPFCLASAFMITIIFLLAIIRLIRQPYQ